MSEVLWKPAVVVAGTVLAAYVIWELRSLILPLTVSGVLAYVCRPLVTGLERLRVPRGVAIGLVVTGFLSACLVSIVGIQAVVPSEHKFVEIKVHALYAVNERYKVLMGLDHSPTSGNRLYRLVRTDANAMLDQLHEVLELTPEEHAEFLASHGEAAGVKPQSDALLNEHQANLMTRKLRGRTLSSDTGAAGRAEQTLDQGWTKFMRTPLTALGEVLSSWIIAPLVFFFLLRDTGEIKRGLLTLVPNRLFEPALAILADLDRAVGNYLRGISLSCFLLGVTIMVLLFLIGVSAPLGVRHRVVCRPDQRGALSGIRGRLDSRARVCLLRGGIPPPIARDRKGQLGGLGGCGGASRRRHQKCRIRPTRAGRRGTSPSPRGNHWIRQRHAYVWFCGSHSCDSDCHHLHGFRLEHGEALKSLWPRLRAGHSGACLPSLRHRNVAALMTCPAWN